MTCVKPFHNWEHLCEGAEETGLLRRFSAILFLKISHEPEQGGFVHWEEHPGERSRDRFNLDDFGDTTNVEA